MFKTFVSIINNFLVLFVYLLKWRRNTKDSTFSRFYLHFALNNFLSHLHFTCIKINFSQHFFSIEFKFSLQTVVDLYLKDLFYKKKYFRCQKFFQILIFIMRSFSSK